jgi:hypothetical protein
MAARTGMVLLVGMGIGLPRTTTAASEDNFPLFLPALHLAAPPTFVAVAPQGVWTGEWWNWVERLQNQPVDAQGAVDCTLGQTGDVWFLAGTPGDLSIGPVTRTCTVPAGKTLVGPLFTILFYNGLGENYTFAEKLDMLDAVYSDTEPGFFNAQACQMISTIDGVAVDHTRLQSPPFTVLGDPEAAQDGYWFAFQPGPGVHVVHFGGALCEFGGGPQAPKVQWVDVTYTLTVQ